MGLAHQRDTCHMPLGHLGVNVSDLERSRTYYRRLLPVLGFEQFLDNDDEFAWRPEAGKVGTYLFFYPATDPGADTAEGGGAQAYSRERTGLQHLAFIVGSRAAVMEARDLAVELGSRNITVNAIAPGFFSSRMTDHVFENAREEVEHNCLLRRVGEPAEMAGIAVYLSARAGAYTHGAVIPVDGGTSINHQHAVLSDDNQ